MSTFKQFGGIGFNQKNNIATNTFHVNTNQKTTGIVGDTNTRTMNHSHIDLSGNSILRADAIYFIDGTILRTASAINLATGSESGSGSGSGSGPPGPAGPPGPIGPEGPAGKDGTNTSVLTDINHNTNVGSNTLIMVTSGVGKYNGAFGERSLFKNTTGIANTAMGYESMVNNTVGKYNTAVGTQALAYNLAGNQNTCIGAAADTAFPGIENSCAIGAGAKVSKSNAIQLGNTLVTEVNTSATINARAKNFSIPHPLPALAQTHTLKHTSVEAPRLDLIYRDTVRLDDGEIVVNIDKHFGMTDGTFLSLCRNPSVFVNNQDTWAPVRGFIKGADLTILTRDSFDNNFHVSFMVVAERKDPSIIESEMTNSNGKLILETETETKTTT